MKPLIFILLLSLCTAVPAGACDPAKAADPVIGRVAYWMSEPAAAVPAAHLLAKIIALVDDQLEAPDDFSESDESTIARRAAR